MSALFVSDVHLAPERPAVTERFLAFLGGPAAGVRTLYVLGDLFEAWLGDDMVLPEYRPVLDAFRRLADQGVAVQVMHGNRDFLLGDRFAAETGCTLLQDPTVIDLDGRPALLMHGDTLCTDDKPYQSLRRTLRDPAWIADFLKRPPSVRLALARELREQSRNATRAKDYAIMDVNADAVENAAERYGVDLIIHGHTHRPAVHRITVGRRKVERVVLGEWGEEAMIALAAKGKVRLEAFRG